MSVSILKDLGDVIAVDKPVGWLTVPGRGNKVNCPILSHEVGDQLRQGSSRSSRSPDLYVVHRLDEGTSGVVLFARSAQAHKALCSQFENGQIEKTYLALVSGTPKTESQTIDQPLFKLPSKKVKSVVDPKGKPSQTVVRTLETRGEISLVEARPLTGRSHQIRVHLSHLGLPLLGDELYGGPVSLPTGIPMSYPLLHAYSLQFKWPSGQDQTVKSPISGLFLKTLRSLDFKAL